MGSSLRRMVDLVQRSGSAVLDQALYSGSNFLVNILLARWLSLEEYGAIALAFSIALFITALHSAILTEPMLAFGASRYADRFSGYLGVLLYGHLAVSVLVALVIGAAAMLFRLSGSPLIARTLGFLALASPFVMLASLARRAYYVVFRPLRAAIGSAVYLAALTVGIYACYRWGWLDGGSAMGVMGASAGLASLGLLLGLKPAVRWGQLRALAREVVRDHWRYGRWSMGSSLLSSSYGTVYYVVIAAFLSLHSVAVLKAVQNLFAPESQSFLAVALLLVPWSARRSMRNGPESLTRDARRISAVLIAAASLYLLLMATAGSRIADLLYAGKYSGQFWLISVVAVIQLFAAAGGGVQVALRASGRSDLVFAVNLAGSCLSLLAAPAFVAAGGFRGAAFAIGVFPLSTSVLAWWLWLARGRRASDGSGPGPTPQG